MSSFPRFMVGAYTQSVAQRRDQSEGTREGSTLELPREPPPLKLRSRKIRIDVVGGPEAGKTVELPGPEARVGSGKGCDLTLADATVSRHHITITITIDGAEGGGRVRVRDADSKNGTILDGTDVRDAYARPDSLIAIG